MTLSTFADNFPGTVFGPAWTRANEDGRRFFECDDKMILRWDAGIGETGGSDEAGIYLPSLGSLYTGAELSFKLTLPSYNFTSTGIVRLSFFIGTFDTADDGDYDESPLTGLELTKAEGTTSWTGFLWGGNSVTTFTPDLTKPYYKFTSDGANTYIYNDSFSPPTTLVQSFATSEASGSSTRFRVSGGFDAFPVGGVSPAVITQARVENLVYKYYTTATPVEVSKSSQWNTYEKYTLSGSYQGSEARFT